jgi:TetR/AcrR family tetracycline transcriptional repressor
LEEGPALDQSRIVEVIVKIAREEGLGAMNMRRVASELNVSPRLLYHYVRDKDEMIDILSDAITGRNMPDLSSPDWEVRLRNVAMSARIAYADFPGVPATILARTVSRLSHPHALQVREGVLQALRDAGLSQENVELSYVQFCIILFGSLVLKENLHPAAGPGGFAIDPARAERSIDLGLDLLLFGIRRLAEGVARLPPS